MIALSKFNHSYHVHHTDKNYITPFFFFFFKDMISFIGKLINNLAMLLMILFYFFWREYATHDYI